jgi:hypothetical protein
MITSSTLVDQKRYVGGGYVVYVCDARGTPPPTVTWYYNGAAIQASHAPQGIVFGKNTLTIPEPQIGHSGIYQCVANNTFIGEHWEASIEWALQVRAQCELTLASK